MHLDTHPKRRGLWVSQQFAEECRSAAIQQTQAVEFRLKIFRIDYLGIKRISEWMTGMLCFSMKFTHFAEYFHKLWIRGIFRIYRIFLFLHFLQQHLIFIPISPHFALSNHLCRH